VSDNDPKALADQSLPAFGLKSALPHLRRPFTAEAVRWKTQAGTLVVPFVDARLVIERLNLVVGDLWSPAYRPDGRLMWCDLTIDNVTRSDVGSGYEGKGLVSDSLKRAAVHFGVGVSLYALKKQWLEVDTGHLKKEKTKDGKARYSLTRDGEVHLRETYTSWLPNIEAKFGPVLDHGDAAEAVGDVEADTPASGPPQPELAQDDPLDDAKAHALIDAAQKLYEGLTKEQAKGLTKAAFKRQLAGATTSYEGLERLVAELEQRSRA
jgi:hypothetical protein